MLLRTMRIGVLTAGLAGLGCETKTDRTPAGGSVGTQPPTQASNLERPDPLRIHYDASARVLTLYDLPAGHAWLLHLPTQPTAVPLNTVYHFMAEPDLDRVAVSYTTGRGPFSSRVTLREILTAPEQQAKR
jgi:hypothetical protein